MIRHTLPAAFGLVLSHLCSAQEWRWTQRQTLDIRPQRIYLDPLDNLITMGRGELVKYDATGRELTRYSNKAIGSEVRLDVTNPMKILLFAPDQMRIIFLDSRLGEMQESINLFSLGYAQVSLAATSHTNGFWIYDPVTFQLIRHTQTSEVERRSLSLAQLLRMELFPTHLIEMNRKVYLTDPNHGVFEFDIFGNYIRRIPITGIHRLRIVDDRLFYAQEGRIKTLHLVTGEQEVLDTGLENEFVDFYVNRKRLAALTPANVRILEPTQR